MASQTLRASGGGVPFRSDRLAPSRICGDPGLALAGSTHTPVRWVQPALARARAARDAALKHARLTGQLFVRAVFDCQESAGRERLPDG